MTSTSVCSRPSVYKTMTSSCVYSRPSVYKMMTSTSVCSGPPVYTTMTRTIVYSGPSVYNQACTPGAICDIGAPTGHHLAISIAFGLLQALLYSIAH